MSIVVRNCKNVEQAVVLMEEVLPKITAVDFNPRQALEVVAYKLAHEPDASLCLIAINAEEKVIEGILFADKSPEDNYSFVYFVWVNPKTEVDVAKMFYDRLHIWTADQDAVAIRMETERENAFARKWGFEPVKHIMELDLQSINDKEYANVNKQRKGTEQVEPGSEESGISDNESDSARAG